MNYENIARELKHTDITILRDPADSDTFERRWVFRIDGVDYCIEWWKNICYLHSAGLQVQFDKVKQSNTWPNRSDMNLQFYDHGASCPVLAMLPWKKP